MTELEMCQVAGCYYETVQYIPSWQLYFSSLFMVTIENRFARKLLWMWMASKNAFAPSILLMWQKALATKPRCMEFFSFLRTHNALKLAAINPNMVESWACLWFVTLQGSQDRRDACWSFLKMFVHEQCLWPFFDDCCYWGDISIQLLIFHAVMNRSVQETGHFRSKHS